LNGDAARRVGRELQFRKEKAVKGWVGILAVMAAFGMESASSRAATLHVDDFQGGTTALGWSGGSSPTYTANGGPNGAGDAFVQISAFPGGNLATYNTSPQWTGNFTTIGAETINVDMMAPSTSAPLAIRLVVMGPSKFIRWDSADAQAVPNDGVWRNYQFSLAESDLTLVAGTDAYATLMSSVERVMFRYDPGAPDSSGSPVDAPGGTLNLDNITLAVAPTPLAGDLNADGVVDGVDLNDNVTGWKARFGVDLDGRDFLSWQRNLGAAATATAARSVPEPAAWQVCAAMFSLAGLAIRTVEILEGRPYRP
jgi:hypothetical protein